MHGTRRNLSVMLMAVFTISACSGQATPTQPISGPTQALRPETAQTSSPELTSAPTQIIEPVFTPTSAQLPLTEAEVPRVSIQDAKAALDSGEAIVVDVRSEGAYQTSHVPGAIHIELGEFETNPAGLRLDKDQWIITYCT